MKIKYAGIGFIVGAALSTFMGFQFLGWKTQNASKELADAAMKQAAICVAQFVKTPNYPSRLKEMAGKYSFEHANYIEKGGWAKTSAETRGYPVTEACVVGVETLIEK